ncbi:MAG: RNA-binding S4 domain-containing protein [Betaproteobacteria bacterium]|nr:RNA-binding S4 domain-containing protein [Betaproteobacteria bacterium]
MNTLEFELRGEYVALCDLLKLTGLADSGGHGKALVAAGEVRVDGQPESRKAAKIRAGQVVECLGMQVRVQPGPGQ